MHPRVIPIVPARPLPSQWPGGMSTRLTGQSDRVESLRAALETAVAGALGQAPAGWLRELRLDDDEAYVGVAAELGRDGVESAEIAFETLRRLLPDTDIYVGAAHA